jgi:hypothetical protein
LRNSSSRKIPASAELKPFSIALRRIIRCHHAYESHGYDHNEPSLGAADLSTVARLARTFHLTQCALDVSDAQPSYSVCTIVSTRLRLAAHFGTLLLPLDTNRKNSVAYAYLADLPTIRAIGSRRSEALSATWP